MTTLGNYSKAMLERAADVYDKARDLIMERGWWKIGNFRSGGVCVESAIGYVMTEHEGYLCGGATLVDKGLCLKENTIGVDAGFMELTQHGFGLNAGWNDYPGTTVDDVYDKLMHAAKECREEAGRRSQVELDEGDTNE